MCLGRTTSFSRKTVSSPNAFLRLGARPRQQLVQLVGGAHDAHAAAAAARRRLDDDRVADPVGEGARRLDASSRGSGVPGTIGTPAASAILRAATLSPSASIASGVGPTKTMPGVAALARERRALGQQAVARVDRVDLVALRQLDDLVLGQVGGHRLQALADQVGLVRLVAVQVDAVLFGEDRDRAEPELGAPRGRREWRSRRGWRRGHGGRV